jgi:hypothetical protein
VDSGLEEVRQLRAEGLSLPGDRRPGRLPLDPGQQILCEEQQQQA